jgi:hypothetical protein
MLSSAERHRFALAVNRSPMDGQGPLEVRERFLVLADVRVHLADVAEIYTGCRLSQFLIDLICRAVVLDRLLVLIAPAEALRPGNVRICQRDPLRAAPRFRACRLDCLLEERHRLWETAFLAGDGDHRVPTGALRGRRLSGNGTGPPERPRDEAGQDPRHRQATGKASE